jgi:predicted aspartyl protease
MVCRIPLEVFSIENEGYHIFIPAVINNMPARLLIDTGASRTVFDRRRIISFIGDEEALVRKTDKLSTGLGTNAMESAVTLLQEFRLGNLFIREYQAVVLEMSHVNESYDRLGIIAVDGVLGGDILREYGAVIDYSRQELKIRTTRKPL